MLKKFTFKGGVHPADNKAQTNKKRIVVLQPPETLIFPLSQHLGAPCTPCVKVGDRVLKGQKIADSEAFVSAPIHSSVSGTVKAIKPCPVPNGSMVESIIIQNDFQE